MQKFASRNRSGFTLIEVLIALTIISVTFIGVSGLISSNLRSNQLNQALITANYLNQEALEVSRHLRDSGWLNNFAFNANTAELWGESLYPPTGKAVYKIEERPNFTGSQKYSLIATRPGYKENRLYRVVRNDVTYYTHENSDNPTNFARYITVEPFSDPAVSKYENLDPLKVTATTVIDLNGRKREVNYYVILTDWKQGPL
ncbi:prepilin-type N-terminal cleavage/methylation domain-containing protein [Candidatus Gracilibacteria bacterium]|jgi:prepilin-type N-terminal cleavage/methylation domain-containing protein|nr:prepilin-type N-terminal cleavage/methylation domain-containing protein [Candidatus Gracilibacteria bacterium]